MRFTLRPIAGTPNFLIMQRAEGGRAELVAEIVAVATTYVLYRMDATGELASNLASPEDALSAYVAWVERTNPDIAGVPLG